MDKYKARFVAKGFKQVDGLDYFKNFAPTCKPETFRILLKLSAKLGFPCDAPVWCQDGFPSLTNRRRSVSGTDTGVFKTEIRWREVSKSIFCLKQAAINWYKELASFLLKQGFTRSRNNLCLFARADTGGHTFILFWVEKIIVASRSMTVISDFKTALKSTFHMEGRGRLHLFLGLWIKREEGKVTVNQECYIETKLERFQIDQRKPSRTPADLNLKF